MLSEIKLSQEELTLDIESFKPQENEAVNPRKTEQKIKKELKEFKKQCSSLSLSVYPAVCIRYSEIKKSLDFCEGLNLDLALLNNKLYEGVPDFTNKLQKGKKILLLDLDETLIHSDFSLEYINDKNIKYDKVIKFKERENEFEENYEDYYDMRRKKIRQSLFNEEKEYKVGIFVRNGAKTFLTEVSKYFEVGIFTASVKEYADAVINYLDPNKNLIKFRLYRNNCININDKFFIKDLRIIQGVDIKDIILLDNSIYSFTTQLNNGILVNSFFNDKNDIELYNVYEYLINYLLKADDVRTINEQFFSFEKLLNDLSL